MDEAANEEVMRINREVLRILDEYWSKPDNLGPEVWAEIEKAMADPCGHLEEISRLRAELAAWREVGEKLEWSLYGVRDRGVVRICPCCGGMEDNHIEVCNLAALLGRK